MSRRIRSVAGVSLARSLAVSALATLLLACSDTPSLTPAGQVDLTRLPHGTVDVEQVSNALTRPAEPLDEEQERLIDAISQAPERFFDSLPPHPVLNEAELVYFSAGRSLELPLFYQDAIERQGEDSPMRIRLALILQRIGMYPAAEREARLALQFRPTDPDASYVLANVLAQAEDRSPARLEEIDQNWSRTLQLAPEYIPLDGTPLQEFQQRLSQVRALRGATGEAGP
jgi:tetratricopeptide (TPR) repeat protein